MSMFETFALFGIDPEAIAQAGIWLIALIIFAESGLLIGFFLPGDTLLIAAGIMAATGALSIEWTIIGIALAAIIGDNVGYTIGRYSGKRLFTKKDGILSNKSTLNEHKPSMISMVVRPSLLPASPQSCVPSHLWLLALAKWIAKSSSSTMSLAVYSGLQRYHSLDTG